MKITDLKVAVIGQNPVVRITTDEGIDGLGAAESPKHYLKPHILHYKDFIIGMDPRDVERVMLEIRSFAAFKPWGAAVSAIEVALWDIAGKAANLPVYKLLGGPTRDQVRVYAHLGGETPEAIKMTTASTTRTAGVRRRSAVVSPVMAWDALGGICGQFPYTSLSSPILPNQRPEG